MITEDRIFAARGWRRIGAFARGLPTWARQGRPDIQFASAEAAGVTQGPTERGWAALKRLGRHLAGVPRPAATRVKQPPPSASMARRDGFFAGRATTRKST